MEPENRALVFWVCQECGLTVSSQSKRHEVEQYEGGEVRLAEPCHVCRGDRWNSVLLTGYVGVDLETQLELADGRPWLPSREKNGNG